MKKILSALAHGRHSGMLASSSSNSRRSLPLIGKILCQMYTSDNNESTLHEVGEKARSTAEEFARQAQEKTESVKQTAKEALQDAEEAVVGETPADKEKFKEKVKKGNYNNIGRD